MALGQQAEDDAAGKQGGASPPAVEVEQAAVKPLGLKIIKGFQLFGSLVFLG